MNPTILGVVGPGFLNQAPTLADSEKLLPRSAVWFVVGNGGMGYGDYYWGLYTYLSGIMGNRRLTFFII